jgi:hypothetical protein
MYIFNPKKNLYPSIFPPNSFLNSSFPKALSYQFPFGSTFQFQSYNFYLNSKCHGNWIVIFSTFYLSSIQISKFGLNLTYNSKINKLHASWASSYMLRVLLIIEGFFNARIHIIFFLTWMYAFVGIPFRLLIRNLLFCVFVNI